jgi:hypothetical protein
MVVHSGGVRLAAATMAQTRSDRLSANSLTAFLISSLITAQTIVFPPIHKRQRAISR